MAPAHVKTAGELVALALALEQRASARFRNMAARMREEGRSDLVRLFEGLALEEDRHMQNLRRLPEAASAGAEPATEDLDPDLAALFSAPDAETLRQMSLYDCLAEAVRDEIKAFDLFSYVAATVDDDAVQDLAEHLAKEELEHANALRRMRRQAFHGSRREARTWPKATTIETLDDLRTAAIEGERIVAVRAEGLFAELPALQEIRQSVDGLLSPDKQHRGAFTEARPGSDDRMQPGPESKKGAAPKQDLRRAALDDAKEAFTFYDAVVSTASREDVMLTAQELATLALKRIQLLRELNT